MLEAAVQLRERLLHLFFLFFCAKLFKLTRRDERDTNINLPVTMQVSQSSQHFNQ